MSETPRCLVCDTPLADPDETRDGWCRTCAGKVLHAVLGLRDGSVEAVGVRVAALRDQGAGVLADVVCGVVPFDWQGIADHE